MVSNHGIAKILYEISIYLDMDNVPFKPRAYEKAAQTIESFDKELAEVYKEGGIKALEEIPGVGKSIAEKIEELLTTGRVAAHAKLAKKMPVDISGLTAVEGIGPKHIKVLWEKLHIKNLAGLEKAAQFFDEFRAYPFIGIEAQDPVVFGEAVGIIPVPAFYIHLTAEYFVRELLCDIDRFIRAIIVKDYRLVCP